MEKTNLVRNNKGQFIKKVLEKELQDKIVDSYLNGFSKEEIEKKYNISYYLVTNLFNKLQIPKKSFNLGLKNGMWKGDDVGMISLHEWIRNHKPKPEFCEVCNKAKPYDLANVSGEYKRDISDFKWTCRRCHMKEDGRLDKFINFPIKKRLHTVIVQ